MKRTLCSPQNATSVSNVNWTSCLSKHLQALAEGVLAYCVMQSQTLAGLTELPFTNLSPIFRCPYKIFICKKALIQ